jgi:hypothetical protein
MLLPGSTNGGPRLRRPHSEFYFLEATSVGVGDAEMDAYTMPISATRSLALTGGPPRHLSNLPAITRILREDRLRVRVDELQLLTLQQNFGWSDSNGQRPCAQKRQKAGNSIVPGRNLKFFTVKFSERG